MVDENNNTPEDKSSSESSPTQPQETSPQGLKDYVERGEKLRSELLETINKLEKLQAERLVSGESVHQEDVKVKEESPKDYAKRIMGGSV